MQNNSKDLSICIPSNRELVKSQASITAALNFCESSNSNLVVSDNSADNNKKNFWSSIQLPNFNYMTYENPNDDYGWHNWSNVVSNGKTKFIGVLGDDDLILNINDTSLDYNLLDDSVVGIKPIINLWNKKTGTYKVNNFEIKGETALERVIDYSRNANGENTTLYSFYKKEVLDEIMKLSLNHPTGGGYGDWAFVFGLVSSGKIYHDASKLLIYKNDNWFGEASNIQKKTVSLFTRAGLSARSELFLHLFRAVDTYIYIMRKTSPVSQSELKKAGEYCFYKDIKRFLDRFINEFDKFSENESKAIACLFNMKNAEDVKSNYMFIISNINNLNINLALLECLNIIDIHCPQLSNRYRSFYNIALEENWENIC